MTSNPPGESRFLYQLGERMAPHDTKRRKLARRLLKRASTVAPSSAPTNATVSPSRPGRSAAIAEVVRYLHESAPDRSHQPFLLGHCTVCGEDTGFLYQEGAHPRESLNCVECNTSSRYRSLALGVLRAIEERAGICARSLRELPLLADTAIVVFDTQSAFYWPPGGCYPLPDVLAEKSWITVHTSSYSPTNPWGAPLGPRKTNQTLERLTFPDANFDLVLTSDVMEHVRLYERAHAEIARVLKPGGHYVFTVPHTRTARDTLVRVDVRDPDDPSCDVFLLEPEYHFSADPAEAGVLSYRVFGTSIDEELDALGLSTDYEMIERPDIGVLRTELFFCRKRW